MSASEGAAPGPWDRGGRQSGQRTPRVPSCLSLCSKSSRCRRCAAIASCVHASIASPHAWHIEHARASSQVPYTRPLWSSRRVTWPGAPRANACRCAHAWRARIEDGILKLRFIACNLFCCRLCLLCLLKTKGSLSWIQTAIFQIQTRPTIMKRASAKP